MLARIIPIAAIVIVVGGVALGLATIGPHSHARALALDARRASDVQDIVDALNSHYGSKTSSLPPDLNNLQASAHLGPLNLRDPVTNRPYEYHRLSAHRYRLCITFATATDRTALNYGAMRWSHTKPGPDCQTFDTTS